MCPSFSAHTVRGAVEAATDGSRIKCERLRTDMGDAEGRLSSLERDISSALRQVEQLENDRNSSFYLAVGSAVVAAAPALRLAIVAVQKARTIARAGRAGQSLGIELLTLVPVIGGLANAAILLGRAASAHRRISDTVRRIERLRSEAQGLESTLRAIRGHYVANNCGSMIG